MIWLSYVFYGLVLVVGGAAFVLLRRANSARAWIWLVGALIGAAGLAAVASGRTEGIWRRYTLTAMFALFAVDHLYQYVQSRRAGSPKQLHLWISLGWVLLGGLEFID